MSDTIPQIIIVAVALIVLAVLVASVFSKVKTGKQLDSSATENLAEVVADYDDPKKQVYDGLVVTGAEVKDVVREYLKSGDCNVKVVTKANAGSESDGDRLVDEGSKGTVYGKLTGTWEPVVAGVTPGPTPGDTFNPTGTNKINESGTFKGYIRRDSNDEIVLIAFVQQ